MINTKFLLVLFTITMFVAVASLIIYDQYEKTGPMPIGTPYDPVPVIDLNVEHCYELREKNSSGIELTKEERAEIRDDLNKCKEDERDARYAQEASEFIKSGYESCEQLKADYDGKMWKVYNHFIEDWIKQELEYCKDQKQNDANQLKQVLDSCECQASGGDCFMYGAEFNNGTHYINNNSCEWLIRGLPIYPGMATLPDTYDEDFTEDFEIDYTEKFD